jgi:hypothetical protein
MGYKVIFFPWRDGRPAIVPFGSSTVHRHFAILRGKNNLSKKVWKRPIQLGESSCPENQIKR